MSLLECVLVLAAGVFAGAINTVVGSGTLVTFPVLLAIGYDPVTANVSNTLGLVPGSVSGAIGYRAELAGQRRRIVVLGSASLLGGVIGAVLLLSLPGSAFEAIVPVLIALAVVLVATQPLLQRALARRRASGDAEPAPFRIGPGRLAGLLAGAYATGTYGGYFAASQGVLQIGIFGLLIPESLQRLNALKNVLTMAVNGVAAIAYVIVAPDRVEWAAAGLIAVGALAGGFVGSSYGRRLPAVVLRTAIVVLGLTAIAVLLSR